MLTVVPANQGWERRRGQIQDSSADNAHGTSQSIAFNESEHYNASYKLLLCSVPWPLSLYLMQSKGRQAVETEEPSGILPFSCTLEAWAVYLARDVV